MNTTDNGGLFFAAGIDTTAFNRDAENVRRTFSSLGRDAERETDIIGQAFTRIGKGVAALLTIQQAGQFVRQIVSVRSEIQSLEISFRTLLGNKEKADAMFGQLRDFAVKTPMMLKDLAAGAQTMLGFNIEAEKVMPILKAIGDISMGDSQRFQSLTLAFSQMSATGKLMGQDLLQMINAGFNPLTVVSQQTGKSIAQLKDEMSKGAISAEQIQQAFLAAAAAGGQFHGMLEKQSHGLAGSISNLQGAVDDMMNEIGTATEGAMAGVIGGATEIVKHYKEIGDILALLVISYGAYKAALIAANVVQRIKSALLAEAALQTRLAAAANITLSKAEAMAAARTTLLAAAQRSLNAAILAHPYALAAAGIAALGYGIYKLISYESDADKAQRKLNEATRQCTQEIDAEQKRIDQLFSNLQKAKKGTKEYADAKQAITGQYGKYLDGLGKEISSLNDVAGAYNAITKAAKQAARARAMEKATGEAADTWAEETGNEKDKIRKLVDAKFGDQKLKNGTSRADNAYNQIIKTISSGGKFNDSFLKLFDENQHYVAGAPGSGGHYTSSNKLRDYIRRYQNADKRYSDTVAAAELRFGEEPETAKQAEKAKTEADYNKKDWEEYAKAKQAELDAMTSAELKTRQAAKLRAEIARANRQAGAYSTTTATKRTGSESTAIPTDVSGIARERARQLAQIESETADMRIAAMQAGAEKVAAEREREHQKELAQIARNADDAVQAELDRQKREYEARTGKKDWTDSKADQTAIGTIRDQYAEQAKLAEEKYQRQQLQQQADAMRAYLQQYGTFEQQKLAITQEYERKIAEAQALDNKGQVLSLKAEQSSKLQAVDARAIQTKIDWQSVFGDLTGVLEEQLRDLLGQLRDYTKTADFAKSSAEDKKTIYDAIERIQKQTHGGEGTTNLAQLNQQMRDLGAAVTRAQVAEQQRIAAFHDLQAAEEAHKYALANLTTAEQQLAQQDLDTARIAYQAATDYSTAMDAEMQNLSQSTRTAVQDTKQGLESVASGLQGLASGSLKGAFEGIKNTLGGLDKLNLPGKLGDTVGKMCKTLDNLPLAGAILEILDILKDGFSTIIATLIDTVMNAATGIIGDVLSGDIITNTLSSLGKGLGNLANTLSFGLTGGINWNGGNGEQVRATQAALADSNERLGKRIDDLSDTIKGSRGMISVNAAKEARDAQEQINRNTLGIAQAQMGYHGDHHSWDYYFNGFSGGALEWIKRYAPGFSNTRDGLLGLTPEQMRDILSNPEVRNQISGTGKGYYGSAVLEKLQAYADECADKLDELQDQLNESLTAMSFDSMYSSFVDTLMDMDKDAQDFADDFSTYMMRAMLTNKVGEFMQGRLERWYKQFAGYMESGGTLSEAELADLQRQWNTLAEEGIKYRDEVAKASGYDKVADAQSATSKGVATITEQSAEELNGRFTALQMIGEQIHADTSRQALSLDALQHTADLSRGLLQDILAQQALANGLLEDIGSYTKPIAAGVEHLQRIANNTSRI